MRSNIDILKDRIDALEVIAFKIVRGRKEDELEFLKAEIAGFANLVGHITGEQYDPDLIKEYNDSITAEGIVEDIGTHII